MDLVYLVRRVRVLGNGLCRSTFDFESPIYILPGQQWDVQVTVYNDSRGAIGIDRTYNYSAPGLFAREDLCCLVQYTLYDGLIPYRDETSRDGYCRETRKCRLV